MAKHKAATEISIAQEERSAFAEFVDQYKWIGLGALGAIGAGILWMTRTSDAAIQENREDWGTLFNAFSGPEADASDLADAAKAIKKPAVAAVARISQAAMLAQDRKHSDAEQALGLALTDAPAIFSEVKFPVGKDGEEMTLLKKMQTSLSAEEKWMGKNMRLFENPAPAAGSPRVELNTDKGKIVVELYMDKAPLHAKNFIKLANEGYYDGTGFHRIKPGQFIQGGDPNSRNEDPTTWGQGGPETKVPKEDSGLLHFAGYLAAAKQGGQEDSSGSQFYITATPMHEFDGGYVVYGKVLEGLELVNEISLGEIREEKADAPVELIKITSTKFITTPK